ncbi:hypothetical protein G6F61_014013 [Rhizopus arrhizus]|nr:hypothetical protein G6F61_014013 [Rhizopus arrhizus]
MDDRQHRAGEDAQGRAPDQRRARHRGRHRCAGRGAGQRPRRWRRAGRVPHRAQGRGRTAGQPADRPAQRHPDPAHRRQHAGIAREHRPRSGREAGALHAGRHDQGRGQLPRTALPGAGRRHAHPARAPQRPGRARHAGQPDGAARPDHRQPDPADQGPDRLRDHRRGRPG